ncbi:Methylated-DNA--protein-cysteine methyltransferase [Hydrogenovibrio crunogenus]|uniref:methylated-DNA--[protein]-cysteine S-methyltransferase n=1 Tax=Hydrogenovibrio crunogenus TaxID=39765 RepID=A0A4P7P2B8_9GAMM|nr:MGMT family protein [Hydrogenovibrio crunogenus]QBZ84268.1 Methylated-DNA--protein-cysteine methyltransferase [Hydrogenovibrio crunogenus]RUM92529.1 MAG: cysteine methyltransferase [Thiomicrospira sp.]
MTALSFNEQCYALLEQVPAGKVTTYKALAEALGTRAYQAVGRAMNQNPNPVVVPCHRVVNHNGELGGYAFGMARKIELLTQEGIEIEENKVVDLENKMITWQPPAPP